MNEVKLHNYCFIVIFTEIKFIENLVTSITHFIF